MLLRLHIGIWLIFILLCMGVTGSHGYGRAADVSIGTIIDTVGMVDDRTVYVSQNADGDSNYSLSMYRDSTLTNGGALTMQKSFTGEGPAGTAAALDVTKILTYDAGETGAHLAASESLIRISSGTDGDAGKPFCVFSGGSSNETELYETATATLSILNARTLGLSSSSQVTGRALDYSVSIGGIRRNGTEIPGTGSVITSLNQQSVSGDDTASLSERTLVSGFITLINRMYHAGEETDISAVTRSDGMISREVTAVREGEVQNASNVTEWTGTTVYTADLLANGGNLSELHTVRDDGGISSDRILSYHTNDSTAIQAGELALVQTDGKTTDSSGIPTCVMATGGSDDGSGAMQSIHANSQIMGVASAEAQSSARISAGAGETGIAFSYQADIRSPSGFDPSSFAAMSDPDKDGRYEDLNGNGRLDLQDLVMMFRNIDGLATSNLTGQVDYNTNGRVDFADVVLLFTELTGRKEGN